MTPTENIEDFREVTPSERAALEQTDAAWREPPQSFIDMWNSACGQYGKYAPEEAPDALHPFQLNGLWLTYEEALVSFRMPLQSRNEYALKYANVTGLRTNICTCKTVYWQPVSLSAVVAGASDIEILRLSTNDAAGVYAGEHSGAFNGAYKLRTIYPVIWDAYSGNAIYAWKDTFHNCYALEDVQIHNLKYSLDFRNSPRLSLASLQYIVTNAANTAAITITLHPEAYARVTEEILAAAAAKNITIAST